MLSLPTTDRIISKSLPSECQNLLHLCAQGTGSAWDGSYTWSFTKDQLQTAALGSLGGPVLVRPMRSPAPTCGIEPMLSSAQLCLVFPPSCSQFLLPSQKHFLQIIACEILCQSVLLRNQFKTSPRLSDLNMYPLSQYWHLAILHNRKWWFFWTSDPRPNCHLLSSSLLWLTLFPASDNAMSFLFCLCLWSSHLCFSLALNKIFILMLILS